MSECRCLNRLNSLNRLNNIDPNDGITEANRLAQDSLRSYIKGERAFFADRKDKMECAACGTSEVRSKLNVEGICFPCWSTYEAVKDRLEWASLGDDLEARIGEDGLMELRLNGGPTELFVTEESLRNAIALYDADVRPTLGERDTEPYRIPRKL